MVCGLPIFTPFAAAFRIPLRTRSLIIRNTTLIARCFSYAAGRFESCPQAPVGPASTGANTGRYLCRFSPVKNDAAEYCPAAPKQKPAGNLVGSKCRQTPKSVIASQCRNTGVAIRSIENHWNTMASRDTDCHTAFCLGKNADIGHWFAMTGTYFVYSLKPAVRRA